MDFTVCVRILGWAWRLSRWAAMSLIRCGSLSVVSTVHVRDEMALHPQKKKMKWLFLFKKSETALLVQRAKSADRFVSHHRMRYSFQC